MKVRNTKFEGLKIIEGKNYYDTRGFFREIFVKKKLAIHNPIFWCMSNRKKMSYEDFTCKLTIAKKNLFRL